MAGLSVMLWAFGTWLVLLLIILGIWRHVRYRVPLAYEPGMWSIVFPVRMYGVARAPLTVNLYRFRDIIACAAQSSLVLGYLYRATILTI